MTDLYFLIAVVNGPIFNPISALVIPSGVTNEGKAETETHPVAAGMKLENV